MGGEYTRRPARRGDSRVNMELPDLAEIHQTLEDKRSLEVEEGTLAEMRAMLKKGSGNEVV